MLLLILWLVISLIICHLLPDLGCHLVSSGTHSSSLYFSSSLSSPFHITEAEEFNIFMVRLNRAKKYASFHANFSPPYRFFFIGLDWLPVMWYFGPLSQWSIILWLWLVYNPNPRIEWYSWPCMTDRFGFSLWSPLLWLCYLGKCVIIRLISSMWLWFSLLWW